MLPNSGAIYVAHQADFERDFLKRHIPGAQWLCTYRVALRIFPQAPAHNLQTLRYWLNLPVDRAIADMAHRALPDAIVCAYLLQRMFAEASLEDMLAWTKEYPLLPRCPIGEYRGKPWSEVPVDFLMWMAGKKGMEADKVWLARRELDLRARAQEAEREAKKQTQITDTNRHDEISGHVEVGAEVRADVSVEREAYVKACLTVIKLAVSYDDLLAWFRDEAEHREKWGISKDHPDYAIILNACKARKVELDCITEEKRHAA